ncbi:flagellar hook-length control protein FliK [Massilia sp. UMI-21]|nr:flagellar hook-length control protein FliK [Massilia sp. UMI-21]
MNSASLPASDAAAAAAPKDAAPADGLPLDPALAAALPGAPVPLPFLQFMQADAALPAEPLPEETAGAVPPGADAQEEDSAASDAAQPQLVAMNMPLMPSMMATPAALSAAMRLGAGTPERQARAADAVPATAGDAGAVEPPLAAALPAPRDPAGALQARAATLPQVPQASQPAAAAQPVVAAAGDGADSQAPAPHAATGAHAGFGVAPAAANAAPRDGGTLSLSGPPTAWRQNLHEALGDRLNLQLGKNAEQAVIRLDPPMLGRVEISIRHAAGSLEVNITATHSEVLRQLNSVSENLRSDLAQRQYTDVSVNVSQATPRAQAGAQAGAFGADAQGRGRQQGQDQDERTPGAALAEANQSNAAFSLGGRA